MLLHSNGSLCVRCNRDVKNYRDKIIQLLRLGNTTLGYQVLNIQAIRRAFSKMRTALLAEDDSIKTNKCTFCVQNKISYHPLRKKARQNTEGSIKAISNSQQLRTSWGAKFFYSTKVKTLSLLDSMKEEQQMCDGCYDEIEEKSSKGISHYSKPSRSLTMKIRKRSASLYDSYCEVQGLHAKANGNETPFSTEPRRDGICVKCDRHINICWDVLDKRFDELESHLASFYTADRPDFPEIRSLKQQNCLCSV